MSSIKPVRKNKDVVIEISVFPIQPPDTDLKNITLDMFEAKSLAYSILAITSHIEKDEYAITKSILLDLQKFRHKGKI